MRRSTLEDYQRRLLRAQALIEERLDEDVAPAELAKAAAFSLHHFHRVFRGQLGESVMQYVRRLRLERAARRLRSSDERLLAHALDAGYESHEAFTRAFVERFGTTPSEYRSSESPRIREWVAKAEPTRARVTIATYPAIRVAFIRHRGGYADIDAFWSRMIDWAGRRGLIGASPPFYGLCPDDPDVTPQDFMRFDACVAVGPDFIGDDFASVQEIPAGTYAVGLHVGPFTRLAETYLDVIGRWFPSSGYELAPAAPVVEHYLDDSARVSPDELRTEVRVRIAD